MRILIVTHYFPPEIGAPQARLSELAHAWSSAGDTVTVLTGMPNHPTGVIPPEYKGRYALTERTAGYRVIRTWVYATPNEKLVRKTLGHVSFMLSSVLLGARHVGSADVVLVSSPTFFSIFSAWLLARVKRARFVVEVRDLWPAIFVELGVLKNRVIIRILEAMEMAAYRAADAVVVVSEGFRTNITSRGIPSKKVVVIPNGADLKRFAPRQARSTATRGSMGADAEDVLVLYIGAFGVSQGLEQVLRAADLLRSEPIHFALVGEGARKGNIRSLAQSLELTNVTQLGGVPADAVPELVAAADICLVPLRDVPLFESFIPSKLFEFLGAGKPIVGAVRGEAAEILKGAGAVVVPPEMPNELAHAIKELADDPGQMEGMGQAGRLFVEEHYDRAKLASTYRALLLSVAHARQKR